MTAPAGAPTSEYVMAFPSPLSTSGSVAAAVNVTARPRTVVTSAGTPVRTGPWFASRTMTVIGCSAVAYPSETDTWNTNVPGPSASVVAQMKSPEYGSMAAAGEPPVRLNLSAGLGSGS